eukprot:c17895_g1_i1.p1 GENE.c17895_g1_i1~~c17895_g1_i1.p1  ORF type:complete len:454 (+),score=105.14 c17895_g1_i1:38-1363(+)
MIYNSRIGFCDMGFATIPLKPETQKCECPSLVDDNFEQAACCILFAHPHFTTTVGLLTRPNAFSSSDTVRSLILSASTVNIIWAMLLIIIAAAHIIWALDRWSNTDQFPRDYFEGIIAGIWWGGVTVTTVGYGDKTPLSKPAKAFGFFFLFVGYVITALLGGTIAANLTAAEISTSTSVTLDDISGETVCTTDDYKDAVAGLGVKVLSLEAGQEDECFVRLTEGSVSGIVLPRPFLQFRLTTSSDLATKYVLTDEEFASIDYGIVLPQDTDILEDLNIAVLTVLEDSYWETSTFSKWFGEPNEPSVSTSTLNAGLGIFLAVFFGVFGISWGVYTLYMRHKKNQAFKLQRSSSDLAKASWSVELKDLKLSPDEKNQQLVERLKAINAELKRFVEMLPEDVKSAAPPFLETVVVEEDKKSKKRSKDKTDKKRSKSSDKIPELK